MPNFSYETFISIFNNLEEDQLEDFLKDRIKQLNSKESEKDSLGPNDYINNFISSKFPVYPAEMTYPLFLDDNDIYLEFLKFLKNKSYKNCFSLLNAISQFIVSKFGFYNNLDKSLQMYSPFLEIIGEERNDFVSIKDFYGKNIAACLERSSLTHNLLSLLGIPSTLVTGYLETNDKNERHAYNIINIKNKLFLFDVTNPILVTDKDNKGLLPAISPISLGSKEIAFDYSFILKMKNTFALENENYRKYVLPDTLTLDPLGENKKL